MYRDAKDPNKNLTVFSIIVIILLSSYAINPVTGKRQLMLMTEGQEIIMDREFDPRIISSFGLYENVPLLELTGKWDRQWLRYLTGQTFNTISGYLIHR